jgi:hypothetical protein
MKLLDQLLSGLGRKRYQQTTRGLRVKKEIAFVLGKTAFEFHPGSVEFPITAQPAGRHIFFYKLKGSRENRYGAELYFDVQVTILDQV